MFGIQRQIKTHIRFLAFTGLRSNADLIPVSGEDTVGGTHSWNSESVFVRLSVDSLCKAMARMADVSIRLYV